MERFTQPKEAAADEAALHSNSPARVMRIRSEDLFQQQREVEIDHHGRIYRLRLTQLNKLILTA